jgi:hypothetical protein
MIRLIAFLLISCLAVDPSLALGISHDRARPAYDQPALFQQQTLNPRMVLGFREANDPLSAREIRGLSESKHIPLAGLYARDSRGVLLFALISFAINYALTQADWLPAAPVEQISKFLLGFFTFRAVMLHLFEWTIFGKIIPNKSHPPLMTIWEGVPSLMMPSETPLAIRIPTTFILMVIGTFHELMHTGLYGMDYGLMKLSRQRWARSPLAPLHSHEGLAYFAETSYLALLFSVWHANGMSHAPSALAALIVPGVLLWIGKTLLTIETYRQALTQTTQRQKLLEAMHLAERSLAGQELANHIRIGHAYLYEDIQLRIALEDADAPERKLGFVILTLPPKNWVSAHLDWDDEREISPMSQITVSAALIRKLAEIAPGKRTVIYTLRDPITTDEFLDGLFSNGSKPQLDPFRRLTKITREIPEGAKRLVEIFPQTTLGRLLLEQGFHVHSVNDEFGNFPTVTLTMGDSIVPTRRIHEDSRFNRLIQSIWAVNPFPRPRLRMISSAA